jgi:predicted negative regulator of RcsB-dependent stress response
VAQVHAQMLQKHVSKYAMYILQQRDRARRTWLKKAVITFIVTIAILGLIGLIGSRLFSTCPQKTAESSPQVSPSVKL